MSSLALVAVLIPARNEESSIEQCLRAVLAQDYPHDHMEVLVVDGASTDGTSRVAAKALEQGDIPWKIVRSQVGTTPASLNTGLAAAVGEIVCRVDARSIIPPEYVRRCAELLTVRDEVVVTGGAQVALARDGSARSVGIARALNNRFAMGGSRYRSGGEAGPTDTVYLGAFRTHQLRDAGGWDERFLTNQDYELNRRLGRAGLVWFDDRLRVGYVPRPTLTALWAQYHRFGRWKVRYWRITGDPPRRRQWVMLMAVGVTALAGGAIAVSTGPRGRILVSTVGGGFLFALEGRGGSGGGRLADRVLGAIAMCTVAGAWVSGVLRETLRGDASGAGPQRQAQGGTDAAKSSIDGSRS